MPEPSFEQRGSHFVITIWRDWLTNTVIESLDLKGQQKAAIFYVKRHGKIGNKQYQQELGVSKPTASRHLDGLVEMGVFIKVGTTGKGTYYEILRKGLKRLIGDIMGRLGTSEKGTHYVLNRKRTKRVMRVLWRKRKGSRS